MGKPRIGRMLVLFGALAVTALAADSWSPSPDIGSPTELAGKITFTWTTCLGGETKTLTASRAGDLDTRNGCIPDDDWMRVGWPKWIATNGTFAGSVPFGTSADWTAPTYSCQVTFYLYEDDVPKPIDPEETGSRDDGAKRQDSKTVSVQGE